VASPKAFVLLIQPDHAEAESIRRVVAAAGEFQLQCVENLPIAAARLGGGGVDIVILDLSLDSNGDRLAAFLRLRQMAPRVPIVVLHDSQDEGLALRAMRAGAADSVSRERCAETICRALRSALELKAGVHNSKAIVARQTGGVVSFIGAKGGVGATTVALNVASVLAKKSAVTLVEMRPAFGTLLPYLKHHGPIRNSSHLFREDAGEIGPVNVKACLSPCRTVPGLSVLYGPQSAAECGDLAADRVKRLIESLAGICDYVVLDLPASLSDANRAAIEASALVVLVTERDPVCLKLAGLMARAMEAWAGAPQPVQVVIVDSVPVGLPMPRSEVETRLGAALFGVVPPDADICLAAQNAGIPLIAFDPDGLVSGKLIELAGKCAASVAPRSN